jgi:hypothetical protein
VEEKKRKETGMWLFHHCYEECLLVIKGCDQCVIDSSDHQPIQLSKEV